MDNPFRLKALFTGIIFLLISFLLGWNLVDYSSGSDWTPVRILFTLLVAIVGLLSFALGGVYIFISSRLVSRYHTLRSGLAQFLLTYVLLYIGERSLRRLRSNSRNPRKAQEKLLLRIISDNGDTEYGAKFNLRGITCLSDLRSKHPLSKYDHYESYVQRVAKGEGNPMATGRVSRLVLSSGTTGKVKLIPADYALLRHLQGMVNAVRQEAFPDLQPMQRGLRLHCNSRLSKSEGGITIASGSTLEKDMVSLMVPFSTPPEGFLIASIKEAFYVHFLFAIRERDLGWASGIFASMFVDGFRYFEDHWPQIVHDLANGSLNGDLDLPGPIRESLTRALGSGDPGRAEEVRRECEKGQRGIMKRLWPRMVCVAVNDNIGIRERLMETIAEGLVVFSWLYGASEAMIGLNCVPLQRGKEEYMMLISDFIYEFIPEEDMDKPDPRTLFIDEVEIGKAYELVTTYVNGFYRFRMGDVVQVSGFHNNAPKVKFLYRTGMLLNMFGEKVDQVTIVESLNRALSELADAAALKHYCVVESTLMSGLFQGSDSDGGGSAAHYVFFLEKAEPSGDGNDSNAPIGLGRLAQRKIDEAIQCRHAVYRSFRETNKIGICRVHLVNSGAFDELKSFILANTTTSEMQFKMPKKLRTREMAEVMCKNIK